MKALLIAIAVAGFTGGAAQASNELVILTQSELLNSTSLNVEGDFNRLEIVQEHSGGGGANVIDLTVRGDLNGGPLGSAFTGPALSTGLAPGTIVQRGFANAITATISGTGNLFAFAQIGSGNSLTASVTGNDNQAAVLQSGSNNHAGFTQSGIGNAISIVQKSW